MGQKRLVCITQSHNQPSHNHTITQSHSNTHYRKMGERDGFYGPGLLAAFMNGDGPINYHTSVPCDVGDCKGCGLGEGGVM